jgi:NADPH2:quinone reductase
MDGKSCLRDFGRSRYPPRGTHASHLVIETAALVETPSTISMDEAAGIGVPFVTAIEGFRRSGMPKPGETVVIMGVNGKVGQAAVQLATWQGAKVIGVVRKDESYEGHANAPVEIVNSATTDVAKRVRELTDGNGADIVFNTVGDPISMMQIDPLRREGARS